MSKTLEKLICSIVFLSVSIVLVGQNLSFVNIDTDPKNMSLGFIDVVSDNVENSAFSNPALMSFNKVNTALAINYGFWQPETFKENRFVISGSHKLNDKWSITAGLANGIGTNYEMYDNSGNYKGKYRPLNFNLKGGASYKIAEFLSLGMNAGFAYSSLSSSYKNLALLTDFFVSSSLSYFKFAIGAKNLGIAWDNYGRILQDMPLDFSAGVSYTKKLKEMHDIGLYTQYDFMNTSAMSASIGASYSYGELIFVRAGGRIGFGKVESLISVGGGLSLKSFEVNAAYVLPINTINLSNTFSLSLVYYIGNFKK